MWNVLIFIFVASLILYGLYELINTIFKTIKTLGERPTYDPAKYPYRSFEYIKKLESRMNKLYSEQLPINLILELIDKEKNGKSKFVPSDELKQDMNDYLVKDYQIENLKKEYNFVIEANAAITNSKKTFEQVEKEKNEFDKTVQFGLGVLDIPDKLDKWIENINRGKSKRNK